MATMKLGTETASVSNHLMSGTNGQPSPEVGMGVTVLMWTDRQAGTISRVSPSGKTLWFRMDTAIRIDSNGMSDCQEYRFEAGNGPEIKARQDKRGAWKCSVGRVRVGDRSAYHDYSF